MILLGFSNKDLPTVMSALAYKYVFTYSAKVHVITETFL